MRETRISESRGKVRIFVKAGDRSTVPVFTGFEVDVETAEVIYKRLGSAIRHAKQKLGK